MLPRPDTSGADDGGASSSIEAPHRRPRWFAPAQVGLAALLAWYVGWLFADQAEYVTARDLLLYTGMLLGFAAGALIRALLVRTDRLAWLLIGAAMVLWAGGDAFYTATVGGADPAAYPPVADLGYLPFFAFAYAGVLLLLVGRTVNRPVGAWVDGILVALGAAALLDAIGPQLMGPLTETGVDLVLKLASPVGDLVLLSLLIGILGVLGWRAGAGWWLLVVGAALLWVADSLWLLTTGTAQYEVGAPLDLMWLLAFGCLGVAAWLPVPPRRVVAAHAWSAVPPAVTGACLLLLLVASRVEVATVSVALAASAVALGLARTGVTLRRASRHAEVIRLAYVDELTGLANRRKLGAEVDAAPTGALVLIDVDGFRQVNESLGHMAGDELLRAIALRLVDVCDGRDVVAARLGGDEFAVFLRGPHRVDSAVAIGQRFREVTAQPVRVTDVALQIDCSVGIAMAPQHGTSLQDLLRAADTALYRAKHTRAGLAVFEPGLDSADPGHLMFLQELRQAINSEDLVCVYQPKIRSGTGEVAGVEALVRWRHPERGEISPAEFVPFAERTALIRPLAKRVLKLAIHQLGEWRDAGLDLTMSVNLSAMNLLDPRTPVVIAQLLAQHAVPADRLVLEITESVFLSDVRRGRQVLQALQGMGCQISIDDYGTGFSSLGQIQSLPAQELKLDSSFVIGVSVRPQLQSIVSATVLLAHGLGMSLVAEGVESEADLRMVADLGCDLAQGFGICPPLAPLDAGIWLSRRRALPAPRRRPADGHGVVVDGADEFRQDPSDRRTA